MAQGHGEGEQVGEGSGGERVRSRTTQEERMTFHPAFHKGPPMTCLLTCVDTVSILEARRGGLLLLNLSSAYWSAFPVVL